MTLVTTHLKCGGDMRLYRPSLAARQKVDRCKMLLFSQVPRAGSPKALAPTSLDAGGQRMWSGPNGAMTETKTRLKRHTILLCSSLPFPRSQSPLLVASITVQFAGGTVKRFGAGVERFLAAVFLHHAAAAQRSSVKHHTRRRASCPQVGPSTSTHAQGLCFGDQYCGRASW